MKILVACEESQAVTIEFRNLGHEAYSCDLEPCSGGHPEWHLQQDVFPLLNQEWDMIIAFPPCTHLAVSGAVWFEQKRKDGRQQQGVDFFMKFTDLKCKKVLIENPVGIMSRIYREPDQITQPWKHGHTEQKSTCFWLKGLPRLKDTNVVFDEMMLKEKKDRERLRYLPPGPDRAKIRSKTFSGIAKAIAAQYGIEGLTVPVQQSLF